MIRSAHNGFITLPLSISSGSSKSRIFPVRICACASFYICLEKSDDLWYYL